MNLFIILKVEYGFSYSNPKTLMPYVMDDASVMQFYYVDQSNTNIFLIRAHMESNQALIYNWPMHKLHVKST